ncbi:MAG: hypothetical protein KBD63_00465 [Bacteriovoracaceae bacterium]|nr:hypothetical protein [Bacteriovoracaceae bacterium]
MKKIVFIGRNESASLIFKEVLKEKAILTFLEDPELAMVFIQNITPDVFILDEDLLREEWSHFIKDFTHSQSWGDKVYIFSSVVNELAMQKTLSGIHSYKKLIKPISVIEIKKII